MGFLETAITLSSTCFSVFNAWTCWGQNKEKKSDMSRMRKQAKGVREKQECRKGHKVFVTSANLSIGLKLFSLYQSALNPMGQQ